MSLVFAAFCPHPPLIIPTIGSKEDLKQINKTILSFKSLAQKLKDSKAETLIIISPHGHIFSNVFSINTSKEFFGDFSLFDDFSSQLYFNNDLELSNQITNDCSEQKIPLKNIEEKSLDHGSLVPLYFLSQKNKFNIIPIGYSFLSIKSHFTFGQSIQRTITKERFKKTLIGKKILDKKIAVVASGDMSHRLNQSAPAGYSPLGRVFDESIISALLSNNAKKILDIDPNLSEKAGECGFRSLAILLGILDGLKTKPEVLSYENPFGVGYLTVNFSLKI
ncbi:MAG: class III extradiol dioxygenase subunit B-like domain-containing protein [Candidatus Pacebacteria bacterium]|nr:class III extradiol dioxygenase subunit B-like domain-containing protein [Candidatus Paceibacterota bacterium]